MATVAVLGIGLLGEGFALQLIDQGHAVRVYNRTASKCEAVGAAGGTVCTEPAEAVRGAERVHLVLSEDAAVDAVIDALLPGLADDVPIVDHSTNLPRAVGQRTERLAEQGIRYVHAPVFMGPKNSRDATGMMLISGTAHADLDPVLRTMTGQLVDLGDDPTRAATVKIAGNGMMMQMLAGVADLFRIADANGMPREELVGFLKQLNPGVAGMGKRILRSQAGQASFHLSMARKDVRLMIEAASGDLITLPAIAEAMDRALDQGLGDEDFTAFVRD